MKIAIIGYSGSGKSTLARQLGDRLNVPVLHLDSVHWLPGWQERPAEEGRAIVNDFLDRNADWIIDGNYSSMAYSRRMEEADRILYLDFPRRICLPRVLKRWITNRGKTRPDMGAGCTEKIDAEFLWWILWKGRTRKGRERRAALGKQYSRKFRHFTRPRDVKEYLSQPEE